MADPKKKEQKNIKLMISNRRFLFVAIVLCAMTVLIGFTVIFPKIQQIQARRSELSREQARLEKLERKNQILASVSSIDFYAEKDRINVILPSYKPLLPVIQRFENISGESNVIVSGFAVSPGSLATASAEVKRSSTRGATATSNVEGIDLELNVIGDIQNINSFLKAIDVLAPITEIKSITLATSNKRNVIAGAEQEDIQIYDAKLALTSFYFVGQPQAQIDRDLPEISKFSNTLLSDIQNFQILTQVVTPTNFEISGGGKENLFE